MKPLLLPFLTLLAISLVTGCSTTAVEKSWVAPEAGSITFETVMVLVATPDIRTRKQAEDAVINAVKSVEVLPSYQIIPATADIKDPAVVKLALLANECDGIIVMRLAYQQRDISAIEGDRYPEPYWDFYSYYNRSFGLTSFYTSRPDLYIDDVYGIETNIYETETDKLIWSGQTRTKRPSDIKGLMEEVTEAIGRTMKRQGLVD